MVRFFGLDTTEFCGILGPLLKLEMRPNWCNSGRVSLSECLLIVGLFSRVENLSLDRMLLTELESGSSRMYSAWLEDVVFVDFMGLMRPVFDQTCEKMRKIS